MDVERENRIEALRRSYYAGIRRITGISEEDQLSYRPPEAVIRRRQRNWDNFFRRHYERALRESRGVSLRGECSQLGSDGEEEYNGKGKQWSNKDVKRTDNVRRSDFSSASALHPTILANENTKTGNIEAENMGVEKRLDVSLCSLADRHNVKEQPKTSVINDIRTTASQSLNNAVGHSSICKNGNTHSDNNSGAQLLSDDEIFMVPCDCEAGLLRLSHRKKLYTSSDSPIDLTPPKRLSINRISQGEKTLHPALDPYPQKALRHKRFKRKRKIHSWPYATFSRLHLKNYLTDTAKNSDEGTQSSVYSTADSTSSVFTQTLSSPPLKSNKATLSARDTLSEQLKHITIRENTSLDANIHMIAMNGKRETEALNAKEPPGISIVESAQVEGNNVERDTSNIVETTAKSTEAERESTNVAQAQDSVCKTNAEATAGPENLKPLSYEVQNLETDTVDSDQSTILLCECKTSVSNACTNDNLSFTDSNSRDDLCQQNEHASIVTNNKLQFEDLNPVVLLARMHMRALEKKNVVSKKVPDSVNKLPLDGKTSPDSKAHVRGNVSKRRKLEPVVVLERLEHKNGFPVITDRSSPRQMLRKECESGTNGHFEKLCVDYSGSSPDKKQDKRKNAEAVVVLEKLRVGDIAVARADKLPRKVSVNSEYVDSAVNQVASTSKSTERSVERERKNTRSSERTAANVDDRISGNTSSSYSRLTRKQYNENKLLSITSSDEDDDLVVLMQRSGHIKSKTSDQQSTVKTPQKIVNSPDKIPERENDSDHTIGNKSVTTGPLRPTKVKRRRHVKLFVPRKRIPKAARTPVMKRLRLNTSIVRKLNPNCSASSRSIRGSGRKQFVSRNSKKTLSSNQTTSSKNDDVPNDATRSKRIQGKVVQSCFQTKLNSDSESGLSPPYSVKSDMSKNGNMKKSHSSITPVKSLTAANPNVSNGSTRRRRPFGIVPRKITRSIQDHFRHLDTSDEEDICSRLPGAKREQKIRAKTSGEGSDTPVKRLNLRKMQRIDCRTKQPVFTNKENNARKDVTMDKPFAGYRNLRSTPKKVTPNHDIKVSSKDDGSTTSKSLVFRTMKHYEDVTDESS